MSCRGVHFSLDEAQVQRLKAFPNDAERLEYLQDEIEEEYFASHPNLLAQTDKAWDFIHRVLTDGQLEPNNGTYPLNHVILGGESLYAGTDWILSLKTPVQVADAARELRSITQEDLRTKFFQLDEFDIAHSYEEDFDYTWEWFEKLREFWLRTANERRYILFTVDQ